jgi:hypothetical protein
VARLGDDPITYHLTGSLIISTVVFWTVGLLYAVADVTLKPEVPHYTPLFLTAVHSCAVQCSAVQCTVHSAVPHYSALQCTVIYCTALQCTVHSTVPHCTALQCTVQYAVSHTAQHCTVSR